MTYRRASRTVLAFTFFAVLFICGCGAMLISTSRAQESTKPTTRANPTAGDKNDGQAADAEEGEDREDDDEKPSLPPKDLTPRGPDELFTPLPDEGIYAGSAPAQSFKAIIVVVPNPDSDSDRPEEELTSNAHYASGGFMLMLEQQLEYLPQVYTESYPERVRRYSVLLRQGDAPRAGAGIEPGVHLASLDAAADTFNAALVFAVSFVPAKDDGKPLGAAFRYSKRNGIERAVEWEFGKLATPEADSTVQLLEGKVTELCDGIGDTRAEDGSVVNIPHAPIPRVAVDDKALREFVKLREGLERGEAAKAWIAFESLMKRDPRCGRAALYGMEVFRAMAAAASANEENAKYLTRAIEVGREGVRLAPNDVLLRGRLCWVGLSHFNRFDWAQAGLKQALHVQPASFELMGWWLSCYELEDVEKRAQWLIENGLPVVTDGRIELALGNSYFSNGEYAKGVEWYLKGVKIAPLEHELQMSLGLCANYLGERLAKLQDRDGATDAFATSSAALAAAQDIDPQSMKWVYEYYVRAATHKFKRLPTNPKTLERLFLTQAALNGLTASRRTTEWDGLVQDVIKLQRGLIRDLCREAKPGDSLYMLKLIARLQFDLVEQEHDDLIHTLWLMREMGMRPEIYTNLMVTYEPLVKEYKPEQQD